MDEKWDLFISHASEDKETFVRPLAIALSQLGAKVWYDEFSLELGDSISRSIDKGLAESKYGLVVVSDTFIRKKWPEYELRGLISREIGQEKVILPIWHGVTRDQVVAFSPPLADKLAFNTANASAQDIAIQILKVVRPDIYGSHPRSQLEKMASGRALGELRDEIERRIKDELEFTKEKLSQFQCPFCRAPVVEQNQVPLDPAEKVWDTREAYECGYEVLAGQTQHPCPSDPSFPKLEDFEFEMQHDLKEPTFKWSCWPKPKTRMARLLSLGRELGRTEDEAKQRAVQRYESYAKKWRG
jgi:TIR domain